MKLKNKFQVSDSKLCFEQPDNLKPELEQCEIEDRLSQIDEA